MCLNREREKKDIHLEMWMKLRQILENFKTESCPFLYLSIQIHITSIINCEWKREREENGNNEFSDQHMRTFIINFFVVLLLIFKSIIILVHFTFLLIKMTSLYNVANSYELCTLVTLLRVLTIYHCLPMSVVCLNASHF